MSSPGWGLSGWGDPLIPSPPTPFDRLLNGFADIYRKQGGNLDAYGNASRAPVVIERSVRCRLSTLGAGNETVDPKQAAIRHFKFFMRPRDYALDEHHYIVFESRYFNITSIAQVRMRSHAQNHLEIWVKEVMPSDVVPDPV